ncbi:PHD finger protein enhancer of yellow 3 isoform X2 [Andrena cerasifolii]|uniref:PHD finger protein enhancer of yellow 3 isoform X2 n=1 Tax=Andrena cerasifolii TaxID=2819439 RepID=UPI004037CAD5
MSESPKMGLFGSKDTTEETKKETKGESPDRYAPYCIDSDSETYDTEALSIMDINDIIGVQSEPVSDSTLESEIAALSQIITDSKTDGTLNVMGSMSDTEDEDLSKDLDGPIGEDIAITRVADMSRQLKSTLEELDSVYRGEEATCAGDMEELSKENSQVRNDNIALGSMKLNNQRENSDMGDRCQTSVLTDPLPIVDAKTIENVNVKDKMDVEFIPSIGSCSLATSAVVQNKESVSIPEVKQEGSSGAEAAAMNNEVIIVKSENSIRGSLQLIGEAYSSEDSQETKTDDTEPKATSSSATFNEDCLIPCEKKMERKESCDSQYAVNSTTDMSDSINSDKTCINKDIPAVTVENEADGIEVDTFNCSTKYKCMDKVSESLEDEQDIVLNKYKVDSPKSVVLESEREEISADTTDADMVEEASQAEVIDKVEVTRENVAAEHAKMDVNEESIKLVDDVCSSQDEKHKVGIEEENTEMQEYRESAEYMDKGEEGSHISEACEQEETGASQENKEHVSTLDTENNADDSDTLLDTRSNEKTSTDSDITIIQKENESDAESSQCHSKNVDDPVVGESRESDSLQTIDNSIVLETKADAVELPRKKREMDIEKLDSTEEMQLDSLKPVTDQLSPESSEANSVPTSRVNVVEDTEINTEVQADDIKRQGLEISETETKELPTNEAAGAVEPSIVEETPKDELKTVDFNTISKCEPPMEVELNSDVVARVSQSQNTPDSAIPMDISTTEDNFADKIDSPEENNDVVKREPEINNSESLKAEHSSEEQSQESNEVEDTITQKPEVPQTSDIAAISKECREPEDSRVSEKHEDVNLNVPEGNEDEVQTVKTEEENSSNILAKPEETSELKECKDSCKSDEEEALKQPAEDNTKTVIQSEVTMETDEIKESLNNEDQTPEPACTKEDSVLAASGHVELPVTEETLEEEEDTEEEMNLTLEPEETEMQSEAGEYNLGQKLEKENAAEVVEEFVKEDPRVPVEEIGNTNAESLNAEEPVISDTSTETTTLDNAEDSMLDKTEELSSKEQLEDNASNSDVDKNNLKSILENAGNVEEMFSGEQCQNTQDIVTSILDDVKSPTDFKNILGTGAGVADEIEEVFKRSTDLPLVKAEIEGLAEKLPHDPEDILNKDMEDTISTQNMDSLEGLLGLDLMPEGEDSTSKTVKPEEQTQEQEMVPKDVDMGLLLEQTSTQASDYITDVISSLTDRNAVSLEDNTEKNDVTQAADVKSEEAQASSLLKVSSGIIPESMDKNENVEDLQKQLEVSASLPGNELDMDFEETPSESVGDLEETDSKLELTSDILLENVDQSENDAAAGAETSQPSSEISELESAVKFLQESEEHAIDSPLVLSPKMVESVVDDISKQADASSLFVPDEDICESTSELEAELQNITSDSISISEAEIISEAAKLESERKLAEQIKIDSPPNKFEEANDEKLAAVEEKVKIPEAETNINTDSLQVVEVQQAPNPEVEKVSETVETLPKNVVKVSDTIPKVSILEERLKEPPKIEIPIADMTKVSMSPTTSKDSLLIQRDTKLIAYQKMLESPKLSEKSEPKIMDTPRKDSEKHDFENVGSPRIILKIAKSAITDCGEPRSPKSPKIRSATNSPNPEDSPGQKLGKIKLKLSKGGHPSIISNEKVEETGQWYSEGSSSLSPIGMKIKLSKSGDASIVCSEKYESGDDSKEVKHKFEEAKRTESPIGMKIKLSKSGDASIVQQDSKDIQLKHKDKLDIVQGSPKRTESPIGMKIKLSKSGDASIIQPERLDPSEEHRDSVQLRPKEKLEASYDSPKRTESPIGMKIKLSKSGDASIVSPDISEDSKAKDKVDSSPEIPKRTESPIGMKIKLAKTKGGASIISVENTEDTKEKLEIPDIPKRTESPLGMKIKLSKSGDASIVHSEVLEEIKDTKQKEKPEGTQETIRSSDTSPGVKIKVIKLGETSVVAQEPVEGPEATQESLQKVESPIGMKIKLSKFGDASIISTEKQEQPEEAKTLQETPKRTESPIGMKIKLSKTGDASIIQTEVPEDINKTARTADVDHSKANDTGLGMKIKLLKSGDASIVESDKKERQQRRRDTESPLEMKIKLSKTGHPTIVACDNHGDLTYKSKELADQSHGFAQRYKDSAQAAHKEPALKILKTGHSTILQSNRSELTIEPVQVQSKKADNVMEISPKRKEITIAPIESKKSKLEAQLTQMLPEVTIQPVTSRDQKQFLFDPKNSAISLQQMNVISQEISITQVRPSKPQDTTMSEKLKDILAKNTSGSPMNSDCEIIEHRPELIIVNENSNSSQDVMIIEEVSPSRMPEVKVPKKRGRPRRNPMAQASIHPPPHLLLSRDPLSMEEVQQMQQMQQMQQPQVPHFEARENERPKRTCRSQKSYAPPKRGRGRGRGKRKLDNIDLQMIKKPRMEQDLNVIEASTTAVITIDETTLQRENFGKSPELYKALKQPAMEAKISSTSKVEKKTMGQKTEGAKIVNIPNCATPDSTSMHPNMARVMPKPISNDSKDKKSAEAMQKTALKPVLDDKPVEHIKLENKDTLIPPGHSNWLTPTSKRSAEGAAKQENVSTVQVIDEDTRMSAESGSRSQTPARNISAPASETIVNEESQGSVLSTATTESEKVKVKNRRMEINFDPDEGPFTVDKIAEYEWPLDRKGETFMIQEQISQYLGVKSFKRKYPDLKRRMVDMEERNYLRENALVSEAMCDMGLTVICSSEVLDVMCSDFPDQYEEYRKHMREKQVKEHSKKQKELTAAANAEKNRIDLAEMAVQSALAWNISLNKVRRENRKCSLDLQTFTIHVPKKQQKVEAERKIGHYPVALIPGQYTDYYREYTPAELRYYPLNTVLYGPMRPNERKFDSQSEGSQSDSDSDSSSDDSSEGTQDTEGSQSTMDEVDMEIVNQKDEVKLKCKMCLKALNKHSKNEVLIQCGTCNGHVHPSCIDLTLDMVPHIQSYAWQCTDCKTCAQCHDPADEDKMLFCDMCDRGYHIYCVGLRRVPQGRWHCQECAVCANCGSREPGGMNSDRNSVAQWQHEYKKGDKNTRVYVSTLCVPCSKLWRKGRYCPHCSRCHTAPRLDLEANLVHCSACDKYLHLGCVETKGMVLDRRNYLCDFCAPNRQQVVKPLVSKTLRS